MRDSSELFRRVLFDLRISHKREAGGSGESRGLCDNEYRNWNDVATIQGMLAVCRSLKNASSLKPPRGYAAALLISVVWGSSGTEKQFCSQLWHPT